MKEIGLETLKIIQLDILQALHEFCKEKSIKYSLGCGTMLGAVRHKGYIPWDDDIDVYLMRSDYERFIKLFPKIYNNSYELICLERDPEWERSYARLYDNKTLLVEKAKEKKQIGIGIDVYAIDYVPDDEKEWLKYNKKRLLFQKIYSLKTMIVSKDRSFFKNAVLVLSHFLLFPFTGRRIAVFINNYAQRYNGLYNTYVCECVQGVITGKKRFKAADFDEVIDWPFENHTYKIMKGYDDYLTNAYNDYMTLPPVEKRVTHHSFHAYWK